MRKKDLADIIAARTNLAKHIAAEEVHRLVHDILASLRKGKPAALPGLGRFEPGRTPVFKPEKEMMDGR
ncbi:MAG: HU family DNA-binding protein [Bryobacteraceae bacterium]|nr:HU family DNA-binding protein [Bryobacteraceae bacterium]